MKRTSTSIANIKPPDYGFGSSLFSVRLHYKGTLVHIPKKEYIGGYVNLINNCDPDCWSLCELDYYARKLGLKDTDMSYYFLKPGHTMDNGLVYVMSEPVCQQIAFLGMNHKLINIFVVASESSLLNESNEKCGKESTLFGGETSESEKIDDRSETEIMQAEKRNHVDKEVGFCDSDYDIENDDDLEQILSENDIIWKEKAKSLTIQTIGDTNKNNGNLEIDDDGDEPGDDWNSEDLISHSSSDGEIGDGCRTKHHRRFDPKTDLENPTFTLGTIFSSKNEFRSLCFQHGVKEGRLIRFKRNDKRRCKAICRSKDCPWMICTVKRKNERGWHITSMDNVHKCGMTFNHGCANAKYLSHRYKQDIRIMPHMRIGEIVEKVHLDLNINISRTKALNTKKMAIKMIEGDLSRQYGLLPDYCNELLRANPGSTVLLKTLENEDSTEVFERIYVCFDACKKGFMKACRPLLGLDGTFLKGPHKGILLTAIGLDPNDQIFPVAYAVVEIENTSTWKWFLRELQIDLNIHNSDSFTFISDKQKGLSVAMRALLPSVEHRLCVWHMHNNFKKQHSSIALKDRLWAAARASYMNQFVAEMQALKELDEKAYQWLECHTDPQNWSRAYFSCETKCDILVNNISECLNRVLLQAREKPILSMLECIRFYLMERLQKKRDFIKRMHGELGPKVYKKLEKIKNQSRRCCATHAGELQFQISCTNGEQFTVDLKRRTCSCRRWQLTGLPCLHAVSAISTTGEEPESFVHDFYSREAYERAYEHIIYPINGHNLWEKTNRPLVLPPHQIRLPGRPKKSRRKDPGEIREKNKRKRNGVQKLSRVGKMTYYCGVCKAEGHNSRKCPKKSNAGTENDGEEGKTIQDQINLEMELNSDPFEGYTFRGNVQAPICSQQVTASSNIPNLASKVTKKKRCGLCKLFGHNRSTCTSSIAQLYQHDRGFNCGDHSSTVHNIEDGGPSN